MNPIASHHADPAALLQSGTILPMTPTQALLAGFEFDAPDSTAVEAAAAQEPVESDRLVGTQFRQGFRIGNLNLMIRYEDGSELTEMPEIFRLPNAPGWIRGMANLHGMLIPVFDLTSYLGVERDALAKPMLLVLQHAGDAAGVVIDGMPERLRWHAEEQIDADSAPPRLAPYVRTACLIGDKLCFDLECKALLDSLEQALGTSH